MKALQAAVATTCFIGCARRYRKWEGGVVCERSYKRHACGGDVRSAHLSHA